MNPQSHVLVSTITSSLAYLLPYYPFHPRHPFHLQPVRNPVTMASYPSSTLPSSSQPATAPIPIGVKREREYDHEDAKEAPPPRKRVTISRKACIVCTEDVPKNRFPKLPHAQDDTNKHTSDVCFKCFSEHLRIEVETKGHEGVGCPQCSKPLEESEIRKLASSWTYQE